ncbi:MAG: MalY/PatB family protein [Aminipila sp.]
MQYNFDEIIDRRKTNSENVEGFRSYIFHEYPDIKFPFADDEFIRMWVADMEFATPPEICEAIKERVDKRIFGYTMVFDPGYYMALESWCKRLYDWSFPKEQLVFSPGIIPALYELVGDLVAPDEKFLITTPAYGFFKHAGEFNNREVVYSDLKYDDGYFTVDFDDLEKKAADSKVKLLLWCNPHNPTGRVWTENELKKVAEIVEKYNLWVISDEIHCDLIRKGKKHIPLGKIMPDYNKLVTCMAASKTFNMAGMMFSNIIIRDEQLRKTFCHNDKCVGAINPLSLTANQAAYEKCADWLEQLKSYLDDNFSYLAQFLKENVPGATCSIPEATYLAWVDLNKCLPDIEDMPLFFAQEAGVLLEGGNALFVGNAKGFVRLNLAMPRSILEEGLKRIAGAINKHNRCE